MAIFIEVLDSTKKLCMVNLDSIQDVRPYFTADGKENGCQITHRGSFDFFITTNTYKEIKSLIKKKIQQGN